MKPNILFVDDEPLVLKGLARSLRSKHGAWEIHFANSGPLALEFMAQQEIDVIVTDMRMPEMDGAALLSEVQGKYPRVIRFVLSGQCDKETVLKSVGPSHQYLSKPCDVEDLILKVDRALALRSRLASDRLQQIVSRMKVLPTPPSLYKMLTGLLTSEGVSVKKISDCVEQDPSLSAKILQLTNSSFFGASKKFSRIEDAVGFIGFETLKSLVLNFGILQRFEASAYPWFDFDLFARYSLSTAKAARLLSLQEGFSTAETNDTFLGGLLHNLGILVMVEGMPDVTKGLLEESKEKGKNLFELELNTLQATHSDVGAYLLGLWGLSNPIIECAAYYHRPSLCAAKKPEALMCVHAACVMMQEAEGGEFSGSILSLDEEYLKAVSRNDRVSDWRGFLKKESENDKKSAVC